VRWRATQQRHADRRARFHGTGTDTSIDTMFE